MRLVPGQRLRPVLLAALPLIGLACSSSRPPSTLGVPKQVPVVDAAPQAADPDLAALDPTHRDRQLALQQRTLALLAQAQRLAEEGNEDAALQHLEQALAAALAVPAELRRDRTYLAHLTGLISEVEIIESSLGPTPSAPGPDSERIELPAVEEASAPSPRRTTATSLQLPESDLPLLLNTPVRRYLSTFTIEGEYRSRMRKGLQRAGVYLPMIRDRLRRRGLPLDLAYLPLIESAFSLHACSRASAHGMWQFIAGTARQYGLEINALVDERRDPVRSTDAAIGFLHDLYQRFGDWYLALAAYNSGAGNVNRAIRRSGSRDFWQLRRYLPKETRNYVPAFVAAVIVAKQPHRFGLAPAREQRWLYDKIAVPDALDLQLLADGVGLPIEILRNLNPALRRDLTPAGQTSLIRLPLGVAPRAGEVLDSLPRSQWVARLLHTVLPGESLYSIAREHASSVASIRLANRLGGSVLQPGQTLLVPRLGADRHASPRRVSTPRSERTLAADSSYRVRHRDTLWSIASSFGVPVADLCRNNGLSLGSIIHPGQLLYIPIEGDRSALRRASTGGETTATYQVRRGDTLFAIARRFGVSVSALRLANGLAADRIYPGDLLRIPPPSLTS